MKKNVSADFELVKDLKKGGVLAFEKLFSKYSRKLLYFAKGYLESEEDAKGMVQDVFMKVWENRGNLKIDQSFNAYLFTIAFNFIRMYYRKKYREGMKIKEYHYATKDVYEIDSEIECDNLTEIIDNAIEQLPEKRRLIFRLSRKEGLSNDEIANKLSISKKTVENQITQAIKFLRNKIQDKSIAIILFFYLFYF